MLVVTMIGYAQEYHTSTCYNPLKAGTMNTELEIANKFLPGVLLETLCITEEIRILIQGLPYDTRQRAKINGKWF